MNLKLLIPGRLPYFQQFFSFSISNTFYQSRSNPTVTSFPHYYTHTHSYNIESSIKHHIPRPRRRRPRSQPPQLPVDHLAAHRRVLLLRHVEAKAELPFQVGEERVAVFGLNWVCVGFFFRSVDDEYRPSRPRATGII